MKYSKKEVCTLILGKTVGDMQRLVSQYGFKFIIDRYDGKVADVPKTNKNKTIHIEIFDNTIIKAS